MQEAKPYRNEKKTVRWDIWQLEDNLSAIKSKDYEK